MRHSEATMTAAITEPPDGAKLVIHNGSGDWTVIWRDDAEAKRWSQHDTERWFDGTVDSPMDLHQHVKYARAVYPLGEAIAVFA